MPFLKRVTEENINWLKHWVFFPHQQNIQFHISSMILLAKENEMVSRSFSIRLNSHELGALLECYVILPGVCTGSCDAPHGCSHAAPQPATFPASTHFTSMVCRKREISILTSEFHLAPTFCNLKISFCAAC